jgi:hypothetical protein
MSTFFQALLTGVRRGLLPTGDLEILWSENREGWSALSAREQETFLTQVRDLFTANSKALLRCTPLLVGADTVYRPLGTLSLDVIRALLSGEQNLYHLTGD